MNRRARAAPWRKLLYIQQPYPDNYTDQSFLSQLKRNSTVEKYSYWKLIKDFSLISLHLSIITIVHIIFFGIYKYNWDETIPASIASFMSVLLYGLYTRYEDIQGQRPSNFKSSTFIMLSILTLSPVLKSLSESTSSDSIWTLSIWLCLINLILTNYQFDISKSQLLNNFNPIFATNILIANVIVLASRLTTTTQVFCFILFAFEIHGLFPFFDFWLRLNFINVHWILLWSLLLITTISIYKMGGILFLAIWLTVHFSIVILSPIYFLTLQKYKDELQGPWDPAKPIVN
ncbi:hypothetical protein WICMUC_001608 [Wickerhamomyces mucosus]|uniref:Phosphatidylinositol N-acetylglucosaminyltransferase n=1 Tax=Wickerhamomyces mucosus TaxID=1378264 RepID=A0A9P8PW01_9ASCO|nr:hypothetical protein WICMUC_001608 [Wickerhamomyces mucosus]